MTSSMFKRHYSNFNLARTQNETWRGFLKNGLDPFLTNTPGLPGFYISLKASFLPNQLLRQPSKGNLTILHTLNPIFLHFFYIYISSAISFFCVLKCERCMVFAINLS